MTMRLNIGCGPHYAKGWTNVDVVSIPSADINPDVVASIDNLPFDDGSVELLYAGHCVEHLSILPTHLPPIKIGEVAVPAMPNQAPIGLLSQFDDAMREIARVLAADGQAAFVCPDVYRAIHWWKEGRAEWNLVDACLEGPDAGIDPATAWDGCFHQWNCHEQRLLEQVQRTFPNAIAVPMESSFLDPFPMVSRVGWQCAVVIRP